MAVAALRDLTLILVTIMLASVVGRIVAAIANCF